MINFDTQNALMMGEKKEKCFYNNTLSITNSSRSAIEVITHKLNNNNNCYTNRQSLREGGKEGGERRG